MSRKEEKTILHDFAAGLLTGGTTILLGVAAPLAAPAVLLAGITMGGVGHVVHCAARDGFDDYES